MCALWSCAENETTKDEPTPEPGGEIENTLGLAQVYYEFSPQQKAASKGIDNLTFKLMAELADGEAIFGFSPVTEAINMVLIAAAADETTQAQVAKVMDAPDFETLASAASQLHKKLPGEANGAFLSTASSVWLANWLTPLQSYMEQMDALFGTPVNNVNFDELTAYRDINAWSDKATEGVISQIITEEVNPQLVALWASALYFEGSWCDKFDKSLTRQADFAGVSGHTTVPMMHRDGFTDQAVAEVDGYVMAQISMGKMANFTVILPPADVDLNQATKALDADLWKRLDGSLDYNVVLHLDMPRFAAASNISFTDIHRALGVDWSKVAMPGLGMADCGSVVTFQNSSISIDEDGATAAAVSYGGLLTSDFNSPEPRDVEVKLNRPFMYFFTNSASGTFIFAGRVGDL